MLDEFEGSYGGFSTKYHFLGHPVLTLNISKFHVSNSQKGPESARQARTSKDQLEKLEAAKAA